MKLNKWFSNCRSSCPCNSISTIVSRVMRGFVICALLCTPILFLVSCKAGNNDLESERARIDHVLFSADKTLSEDITLELVNSAGEESYYVGVLNSSLDEKLNETVVAYNSNPSTNVKVAEKDVRYWLTEGITEATKSNIDTDPFICFIEWCGEDYELVYSVDVTRSDGSVTVAGTPLHAEGISNYQFILNRDNWPFCNYKFPWE